MLRCVLHVIYMASYNPLWSVK
uniref:Uncharacterized protein n=1 Tax=Arundo donax TaxID=35708 RepID=A0A0A9E9N7_ARUDO